MLKQLDGLSPGEMDEVREYISTRNGSFQPVFPQFAGIVKTPNVCGGAARIIRTRIPVWLIERMRQLGMTEIDILRSYPTLRAVDLVQAWGYSDAFRSEIETEIRENEDDSDLVEEPNKRAIDV